MLPLTVGEMETQEDKLLAQCHEANLPWHASQLNCFQSPHTLFFFFSFTCINRKRSYVPFGLGNVVEFDEEES